MLRKHKIGILTAVLCLLVTAVTAAAFWDQILIRVAPKAVLSTAVTDTLNQMEHRFADDPAWMLLRAVEPGGNYTAEVSLTAPNALLGEVRYDMTLCTKGQDHQFWAQGTARTETWELELTGYMDQTYVSVGSAQLNGGNHYGITYDTFAHDLRQIPLIGYFIGDNLIAQWDDKVHALQAAVSRDYALPQIPESSMDELRALTLGILALPCEREQRMISQGDAFFTCTVLSYNLDEDLLSTLPEQMDIEQVCVSFYLYENKLIKIQLSGILQSKPHTISIQFGEGPSSDPMQMQLLISDTVSVQEITLTVRTENLEDQIVQHLHIRKNPQSQEPEEQFVTYQYQPSSGTLQIRRDDTQTVSCILKESSDSLMLQTDDFGSLFSVLSDHSIDFPVTISGSAQICKGAQITAPAYKNLDAWSLEDFWDLLSSVGALFGLWVPT